jgi:hypothetical protein
VYAVLVWATVAAHYAFVFYVVAGGFVAARRPKTIWLHAVAVAWAVAIVIGWVDCPLTALERWARQQSGLPALDGAGFVAHYITGVLYPSSWKDGVLIAVFVIVAGSWIWLACTRIRRLGEPRSTGDAGRR